jgi:hypothetical protein
VASWVEEGTTEYRRETRRKRYTWRAKWRDAVERQPWRREDRRENGGRRPAREKRGREEMARERLP